MVSKLYGIDIFIHSPNIYLNVYYMLGTFLCARDTGSCFCQTYLQVGARTRWIKEHTVLGGIVEYTVYAMWTHLRRKINSSPAGEPCATVTNVRASSLCILQMIRAAPRCSNVNSQMMWRDWKRVNCQILTAFFISVRRGSPSTRKQFSWSTIPTLHYTVGLEYLLQCWELTPSYNLCTFM